MVVNYNIFKSTLKENVLLKPAKKDLKIDKRIPQKLKQNCLMLKICKKAENM